MQEAFQHQCRCQETIDYCPHMLINKCCPYGHNPNFAHSYCTTLKCEEPVQLRALLYTTAICSTVVEVLQVNIKLLLSSLLWLLLNPWTDDWKSFKSNMHHEVCNARVFLCYRSCRSSLGQDRNRKEHIAFDSAEIYHRITFYLEYRRRFQCHLSDHFNNLLGVILSIIHTKHLRPNLCCTRAKMILMGRGWHLGFLARACRYSLVLRITNEIFFSHGHHGTGTIDTHAEHKRPMKR